MKKLLTLAMVVTLVTASVALAAPREFVAPNATFGSGAPSTTNNDDSCDIANAPAATLLLPVFEVDFNGAPAVAVNTIFTITNTSSIPQIAHITLWTDFSFPVLDFNVFLTGYDVQGISLYDIIARGLLPGGGNQSSEGSLSEDNDANLNFASSADTNCANLPTQIPASILNDIRTALTAGTTVGCGSARVGSTHTNAVGYVTIDVGNTCSQSLPTDPAYYTGEILFDNTLIGDYQRINPSATTGNFAGGESLVPIRAIPEGGPAGFAPTNLPYTFYDRYTPSTPSRQVDRRQPLPSTFAARFISGGTGSFNTRMAIWREGVRSGTAGCNVTANGSLAVAEIVRFDESENPTTFGVAVPISPAQPNVITLNEANLANVGGAAGSPAFPPASSSGDISGWMYLNLDNGNTTGTYSSARDSQNWVVVQLSAEGRFGVDFDAAYLGNGCSPAVGAGDRPIGPADNNVPLLD